jgi:hypothetical protein
VCVCVCVHIDVCVCICVTRNIRTVNTMFVCVCMRMCLHTYEHVYVYVYMHILRHKQTSCIHADICMSWMQWHMHIMNAKWLLYVCICTCIDMHAHILVPNRRNIQNHAHIHTCILTYIHTKTDSAYPYMHTYMHTHKNGYCIFIHACLHGYTRKRMVLTFRECQNGCERLSAYMHA